MRIYNYFTLGEDDGYGQPTISEKPKGTVKMSITITSQSIQDNINYQDCNYMGLTLAKVDDTYIIDRDGERLKVLYVNPMGRYNQVFMKAI
jgi:hypothetical protein